MKIVYQLPSTIGYVTIIGGDSGAGLTGGSSYVDMPIDINFSNKKTHGTVDHYKVGETITFTPAT